MCKTNIFHIIKSIKVSKGFQVKYIQKKRLVEFILNASIYPKKLLNDSRGSIAKLALN